MQLCQLNIAKMRFPLDSPQMREFVDALDRINALAEAHRGFVWRLKDEATGNATGEKAFGDDVVANMSVWQDVESLTSYVYKSDHVLFMRRRAEWFERMPTYQVLWWIPQGEFPTLQEGKRRLEMLQDVGPSADAFGIKEALRQAKEQQNYTHV